MYGEGMNTDSIRQAQSALDKAGLNYGITVADAVETAMNAPKDSAMRAALDNFASGEKNVINTQVFMREMKAEMERKQIEADIDEAMPGLSAEDKDIVRMRISEARAKAVEQVAQSKAAQTNRRSGDSKHLFRDYSVTKELTASQERSIGIVSALADKFGVNIHIVDSLDGNKNGMFKKSTGEIYVSLEADKGAYEYIAMHELTHSLQQNAPSQYDELKQFVFSELEKSGVDLTERRKQIETLYKKNKINLDETAIDDEILANSIPAILSNETVLNELAKTNPSLLDKIKEFLKEIVSTIRSHGNALSKTSSWRQMGSLMQNSDTIEAIYEKLNDITTSTDYILALDKQNASEINPAYEVA